MKSIHKLERHQYAPELNKIHFLNGSTLPCAGCSTIREARRRLFHRPRPGKVATIAYSNPAHPELDREYGGRFSSYFALSEVIKCLKKKHNVPGGDFSISIKLVG